MSYPSRRALAAASAAAAALLALAEPRVLHGQTAAAPGGFVESATGVGLRPTLSAAEIATFLPSRGRFTFPTPYGTTGVRLSSAAHLEMAVDDHKFHPAASELKVDETPYLVRLRVEGDYGRETRLKVEPRALKADIRLGPAWARWPNSL